MAQRDPKKYHIRRLLNNSSCKNRLDYTCFQNILPFIMDALPHGLIITDLNAGIIYANRAIERITGYTGSELMGKSPSLLNGEENSELIQEEILKRINQNQRWQGELRQRRKDGEIYWVELEVFPIQNNGNVIAWASIQFDKTMRKEAEILEKDSQETIRMILSDLESKVKELQESKEKYKELFQNANDIIYTTDLEGNFLSVNQVGLKTYGYTAKGILNFNLADIVHPSFKNLYLNHFQRELTSSKTKTVPYEVMTVTKDGRKIWLEVSTRLIKKNGEPVGLQGIARDITEKKQMIEAMAKAEQEKDLILSSISEVVIFRDVEMRVRWANSMASETLNIPIDQLIGRHCHELWQNSGCPCSNCPVKETLESGDRASGEISTPDGVIWQIKSFPVKDDNNNVIGTVEIAKDITGRKKMQIEMARFDRMNLIGEMAASFGHEIRNPMTVVKGFLQLLYDKDGLDPYRNYFQIMIEEVDRANGIITEYLSLAKNKVINLKNQSLNPIIEAIYPLILADAIHEDKVIELELQDIPFVVIDKNDIHQLILNLVRNGLEAMTKGGVLTIMTYQDGKEVVLAIKDQGKGIEPSIISKLGIPFITTKENGVGIGLAICYSIVDRNNAQIAFETSSEGTTFNVRFPLIQSAI